MSDIEKLLAQFEAGTLLRPSAEVPNLVDLSRALARLAGVECVESTAGSTKLEKVLGSPDHLIFILADGLGMTMLEELPEESFLANHLKAELRTVFPSTTSVALTSLATATWPSEHAVTGEWTYLPQIQAAGSLLPFIRRSTEKSLTKFGLTIDEAFPLPSVLRLARRDVLTLFPSQLVNSISSTYFSGNRPRSGYRTLAEAFDLILTRVKSAEAPTYTYLYTPRIDTEAHRHGTSHPSVKSAVFDLDRRVERLAAKMGRQARIVLASDHGLLDAPAEAKYLIKPSADLFELLEFPPSGDSRVLYLQMRDGAEEKLRQRFRERYGDHFYLLTTEEVEQLELLGSGPLSPETRSRLGNLVSISSGEYVLRYVPTETTGHALTPVAYHSGLTPPEMRIPLVVI